MNEKNRKLMLLMGICLCTVSVFSAYGTELPTRQEVMKQLRTANAYFMEKWPDPGKSIITNRERPSSIWTRAVYYEGLMALYEIDPDKAYYDYALDWANKHDWAPSRDWHTRNADNQCCGQTYIDLYRLNPKKARIDRIQANIDEMMQTEQCDDWNWIDAIQMAMPVFAKLGVTTNNPAYFDKMYDLYAFTKYKHGGNGLYNPQDNLWWRDKDFVPPYKEPNGEDCYWGRGNGWVVAALVRVLQEIPTSDAHYEEYLEDYRNMLAALVPLQREDGFWNVSLHDPGHFGGKETTGTALFTYGMAWGINRGLINEDVYLPIVEKAWRALSTEALHTDGFLGYVQGTGKEPKDGQPVTYDSVPDFEDYGLGGFLLAGSEIYKLIGSKHPQ